MNPTYAPLARKYAVAFLNVAGNKFEQKDLKALETVTIFFIANRTIALLFNLPGIKKNTINQVLEKLFGEFGTKELLKRLVALLLQHHRAFLLPDVLHQISDVYKQRTGIAQFQVHSSHALDEQQLQAALTFLGRITGKQVLYEYRVDSSLIAGLRLQSDTLLWEHSVKKQLLSAAQALRA